MRRRRQDDDEIEVADLPPQPPPGELRTWDGTEQPTPEWCIETWVDGPYWYGKLWQKNDANRGRTERGTSSYDETREAVVQKLTARYNEIMRTRASRTFHVLPQLEGEFDVDS